MIQPEFITLTGADRAELAADMNRLAASYNGRIEWGILLSDELVGTPRFPASDAVETFRRTGLRLSAHICGTLAQRILAGEDIALDLSGFSRAQVNQLGRHASADEVDNAVAFGQRRGIRTILQCGDAYPDDLRVDWLLDNSFGQGRELSKVPPLTATSAFCGVSGGLSAANVREVMTRAEPQIAYRRYWLDAESALFDANGFSIHACIRFAQAVFR
ncbi:hypothetical protein [Oricola sp.]|uniref:hypothetical protein n=1 Tax=Oricola sp. TaxID=1979950 RepID=UPI003BAD4CD8